MKQSILIILTVLIIVGGVAVYVFTQKSPAGESPVLESSGSGVGVAVSPYDFNANGCVGDEGDMKILKEKCPAQGGVCSVGGESDSIQVALKFADAQKVYPCR